MPSKRQTIKTPADPIAPTSDDEAGTPIIVTNRAVLPAAPASEAADAASADGKALTSATKITIQPLQPSDSQTDSQAHNVEVRRDAAAPDTVTEAVPASGPVATDAAADVQNQDELDQMTEDKTYYLPINAIVQRRSRHVFIFGSIIILLLAAAWVDIAMDAGFVSLPGLHSLTHLFGN